MDWAHKFKKAEELKKNLKDLEKRSFADMPKDTNLNNSNSNSTPSSADLNLPKHTAASESGDAQRRKLEKELEQVFKKS